MSIGVKFFGGGAILMILLLGIGFVLPGTWTVERSHTLASSPEAVFPYLNSPATWEAWVPWPEAGARFEGPPQGPGSARGWDDPEWGDGVFTITAEDPLRSVSYRVDVEEGRMTTTGTVTLLPRGDSTTVHWREEGDFGWNPLMGWVARFMDQLQGRELERSLVRLEEVVTGTAAPDPAPPAPDGQEGAAPEPSP